MPGETQVELTLDGLFGSAGDAEYGIDGDDKDKDLTSQIGFERLPGGSFEPASRAVIIRLQSLNPRRFRLTSQEMEITQSKDWQGVIDQVNDFIEDKKVSNPQIGNRNPHYRGAHRKLPGGTRLDNNLRSRIPSIGGATDCYVVFHCDSTRASFLQGSGSANPGDPAKLAIIGDRANNPKFLEQAVYAKFDGNEAKTVICFCGKSAGQEENKYTIGLRVRDSNQGNDVTTLFIDPKVRNNG